MGCVGALADFVGESIVGFFLTDERHSSLADPLSYTINFTSRAGVQMFNLPFNPHYKLRLPALDNGSEPYVLAERLVKEPRHVTSSTSFAVVRAGTKRYKLRTNIPGHFDWESECGQALVVGQVIARIGVHQDEKPYVEPYVSVEKITDEVS